MFESTTRRAGAALIWTMLFTMALAGCSSSDNPGAPGSDGPTADVAASQDAYADTGGHAANHGQDGVVMVSNSDTGFLLFDLTSLPADAVITWVKLHLTQTADAGANAGTLVSVAWISDDGWSEDELTADEPPTQTNAAGLGSFDAGALDSGDRTVTFSSGTADAKAKNEWLFGNHKLTLRLSQAGSGDAIFHSDESADGSVRPRLEIGYVLGTRVRVASVDEAWTDAENADSPQTGTDYLEVYPSSYSYPKFTYLKFDLSGLPSDAHLQLARLQATAHNGYAYGGDGNVYTRLVADDSWNGATLTWNSQPDASDDVSGHWWIWYDYSESDKTGTNASADLLPVVAGEAAGDRMLSVRLDSPGYRTSYYRTSSAPEGKGPALDVLYTR